MDELELIFPTMAYAEQIAAYKAEFLAHGEMLNGCAGLDEFDTVASWIAEVEKTRALTEATEEKVPATTFLCVRKRDDRLVGMVDIRHCLNTFLTNYAGNVGYSVRKSERRKGYAKEILRLGLGYCKEIGIERALVTCDDGNIGSEKTILANGGVYENSVVYDDDFTMKRFWVTL